jgi:hypothetical protein
MNLPFVLDVLISVVFIYLILSLLASEIQELITTLLQWRAKHLKDSIEHLISGGGAQQIEQRKLNLLINEIYNDPLIRDINQEAKGVLATGFRSLTRLIFPGNRKGSFGRNQSTGPSYIEPETFATVVMERMGVSHLTEKLVEIRLDNFMARILGDVHLAGDRVEASSTTEANGIWAKGLSLGLDLGQDNYFYHLVETFEEIKSDYRNNLIPVPLCIERMAESLDRYVAAYPGDAEPPMRTFLERVAADKLSLFGSDNQRAWITGGLQPTMTDIAAIVDKSSTTYKSVSARYSGMKTLGESLQQRVLDRKSDYLSQCSVDPTKTQPTEEDEQNCLGSALNELTPEEYRIYQDYQAYQRIDRALDYLPKSLKDSLGILARRAETRTHNAANTVTHFRDEMATWFDRSMTRTSGVYKRNAKGVALIIGLIIAIFTNSDTFHIFSRVSSDDELRRVITQRASQVTVTDGPQSRSIRQDLSSLRDQTQDVLSDIPLPITWNPRNLSQQFDCPYNPEAPEFQANDGKIYSLLTRNQWNELYKSCMGTTSVSDSVIPVQVMQMIIAKPLAFLRMFSGWWISGVAIAMGAPFWFDLLGKIINVRNSGSKPKEQK